MYKSEINLNVMLLYIDSKLSDKLKSLPMCWVALKTHEYCFEMKNFYIVLCMHELWQSIL